MFFNALVTQQVECHPLKLEDPSSSFGEGIWFLQGVAHAGLRFEFWYSYGIAEWSNGRMYGSEP